MELHSDMSWRSHIDKTVKKANRFLRRNLKVSNQDTKTAAYKTLVRPTIEYCSSVWSPHTKDAINKRRAARYVTNRYRNTSSVTSMLGDLEWDTLEIRRKKIRLTMMYKIINNLIDIRAEEYLTKPTRQTRSSHSLKYQQFSASTDYYKHSFFPQTTSIWNTLPATVAEARSLFSIFQTGAVHCLYLSLGSSSCK